ncbi:ABC-type spermidine/putrescine transport system, permease component I [Gottschalkia purinilytica]|uniref:ABC-type spermidine/putrescine transport system, permease component I n=1 Tax=Gottschalkia purinilytica TaxID=1503 RepID=A0A0L0W8T6_GOTPU|nr:ABC transporter permease [Gottschalkia purinilytica]KNF07867.1 ABC-type spermidine/putrescine transport system, permease component I [Gottschalkia purinilytica]
MNSKRFNYLLLVPGVIFLFVFVVIPLMSLMIGTFKDTDGYTINKYVNFFKDPYYIQIYIRTLRISLITTIVCALIGFPTAYYMSNIDGRKKGILMALVVFPQLTNPIVRSFSFIVLLGKNGTINTLLMKIGLIKHPLSLLYSEFAIIVGLVYLFLPLMILSLIGVMENIDKDLLAASESLGATRSKGFLKIILPLSIPGLIIGSVLVFIGSLTGYTTPQLLGGSNTQVLATVIYQNAVTVYDWDTASLVSAIMIVTTLIITFVINNIAKKLNPKG